MRPANVFLIMELSNSRDFSKRTTAVTVPLTELLPAARTELAADIYKEWKIVLNYERK